MSIRRVGAGPAIVLLHCLGVDQEFWRHVKPTDASGEDLVTRLARNFTVVTYDFPGHGVEPCLQAPYSIDSLADQLAGVLDAEGFDTAAVVGISMGGLVAQAFAIRHPDRVRSLVLVDTTPEYSDEMKAMWKSRADTALSHGVKVLVPDLLQVWFTSEASSRNEEGVNYVRRTLGAADGTSYAMACIALAGASYSKRLSCIGADTLVICGRDDIPSFIVAAEHLAEVVPSAELVWLEGARHASVIEQPHQFWRALSRHLRVEV